MIFTCAFYSNIIGVAFNVTRVSDVLLSNRNITVSPIRSMKNMSDYILKETTQNQF